jgi:hypothetical protein
LGQGNAAVEDGGKEKVALVMVPTRQWSPMG